MEVSNTKKKELNMKHTNSISHTTACLLTTWSSAHLRTICYTAYLLLCTCSSVANSHSKYELLLAPLKSCCAELADRPGPPPHQNATSSCSCWGVHARYWEIHRGHMLEEQVSTEDSEQNLHMLFKNHTQSFSWEGTSVWTKTGKEFL